MARQRRHRLQWIVEIRVVRPLARLVVLIPVHHLVNHHAPQKRCRLMAPQHRLHVLPLQQIRCVRAAARLAEPIIERIVPEADSLVPRHDRGNTALGILAEPLLRLPRPVRLAQHVARVVIGIALRIADGDKYAAMLYSVRLESKECIPMKTVKYTKEGVVIPSAWVKGWGKPVSVRRGTHMVILESPERKSSRQRLGHMIRQLRRATQELGPLTPEQITAEVAAVRTQRARRP